METDERGQLKWELEEAKRTILQLTQQLGIMERMLQQERSARVSAEFAAQQAANAAEVATRAAIEASQHRIASAFTDQERISMENLLHQEREAREQAEQQAAEAAEVAAVEAGRHNAAHSKGGNHFGRSRLEDFDMEDVSNVHAVDGVSKKLHEFTKAQPSSVHRGTNRTRSSSPIRGKKLSLAEARKAAQEEMEKRIQERARSLSSKK